MKRHIAYFMSGVMLLIGFILVFSQDANASDTSTPMPPAYVACDPSKQWWGSGTIDATYKGRYGVVTTFTTDPAPEGYCDAKEGGLKWTIRVNGKPVMNFKMYSGERNVWRYTFPRNTGRKVITYVQTIKDVEYVIDKQVVKTGRPVLESDGNTIALPGVWFRSK
jgi:hypothetical protein